MIYTVTFNPALDYVMNVKNLGAKDINRSESECIYCGGKGINVSVILTRLGIENQALGFLAGFTGRHLEDMLISDKVKSDFIYLENGSTRINVKIKSQNELDINACGPDINDKALNSLLKKLDSLESGDTLVLAGSIPKSLPDDVYEQIMNRLDGRGVDFVVDAAGKLLINVLKYKPFLIKPNHHELGELFSVTVNGADDIVLYSRRLREMGARNVLVSRGKDGALLVNENDEVLTIGNVPGKIKSSVGCGDSMVAGFIAGYKESSDYAYALRLGAACGNATAFSYRLAGRDEIYKMLESKYLK